MRAIHGKIKKAPGRIHVIKNRCKGCKICVTYCPKDVLEMSTEINTAGYRYPVVKNPDECVDCGLCEMFCPDFAICTVHQREITENVHPADDFINTDSLPSTWCPGCGIGTVVNTFIHFINKSNSDPNRICVLSGVGCTGKIAGQLNLPSRKAIDGRIFELAVHIKSENNDMKVIVFSHNADFLITGAADFISAAKKGIDINVIHINNIIYTITEHGIIAATPFVRISVDQSFVLPFNIPHLSESYGARFIARWTPRHVRQLMHSMNEAFRKPGFSIIEVISPCLLYHSNDDRIASAIERMKFYDKCTLIKQGERTDDLDLKAQDKLKIGKFVDK